MQIKAMLTSKEAREGSIRVAFATKDDKHVNDHFGWARRFLLYDVWDSGSAKAGRIEFDGEELSQNGNDDKLLSKVDALEGCHIVYSEAIGGPAAARLTRKMMQPLVVKDENSIEVLISELSNTLSSDNTPPWLRKMINKPDPNRFESFDDDDEEDF